MLRKIYLTTLFSIFIGTGVASASEVKVFKTLWAEKNPLSTMNATVEKNDPAAMTMVGAEVVHDHQGIQKLYFNFITLNESDFCNPDNFNRIGTVRVNNQPVKVEQYCYLQPELLTGATVIQATASSLAGTEFIIDSFRKSRDTVHVEFEHYETSLSAIGFSQAWQSAGGDAL